VPLRMRGGHQIEAVAAELHEDVEPVAERVDIVLVDQQRAAGHHVPVEDPHNRLVVTPVVGEVHEQDLDVLLRPRRLADVPFDGGDVLAERVGSEYSAEPHSVRAGLRHGTIGP
jgi:hypothetical protein